VVAVPEDVFEGEAVPFDTAVAARAGLSVEADAVRAVAAQLAAAERPLLIAGNLLNTPRGRMALSAVAHGFGVPVVVEFRQQDIFPNADRLYAAQLGFKIPAEQITVLKRSDLLLAVGTDLGDVPTQGFTFPRAPVPEQPMIHVYPDAEVAARVYQPQLRCIADPVAFLEALAQHLPARPDPREAWVASLQAYLQKIRRFDPATAPCLEAQIADFADEIAYNCHDIDDGLQSLMLRPEDMDQVGLWREHFASAKAVAPHAPFSIVRYQTVRRILDAMVSELVRFTEQELRARGIETLADVQAVKPRLAGYGEEMQAQILELKRFLMDHLYTHVRVTRMGMKARTVISGLFRTYMDEPRQMPPHVHAHVERGEPVPRVIADYIAGMTDRFALDEYAKLFDPLEKV
jgi:hypothetical protein